MARHWPFVGRERELAAVRKALDDGHLTGVVLVGPPGVGKTRLARAVADRAATAGAAVRWVMATRSASGIPLGAMGQLLATWDGPGSHAGHLLPHAARHLVEQAGGRRLLLAVDDGHLLDATSAALIHQLAVTGAAIVVVTARTGVTVPDPIFALWKEGLAERIDIHGLARGQSDDLVRQVLGGQVDGATLHHLWELSLGNMLFLRELVEGGLTSGALEVDDDVWRWNGPLVPSPRLTELIDARMGSLDADEQAVLELLAFGEPLGVDTPERIVDADALSAVERKGLIVSERLDRRVELRLAHPLYGEVLRQRTSPRREKTIYRQLAEALEAAGVRRSGDRLRAVTWRLAAGLPTDAEMLRVAAESTMKVDYGAAERLARAAVEQGGGYAASVVLGQVLIGLGRAAEAEELFAGLWFREDTAERRTQLAVTRVTNLYWGLGRPARATTVLRDLGPDLASSTPELATLEAALSSPYDGAKQALELAENVILPDGTVDATRLQALAVATAALRRAGRYDVTVRVAAHTDEAVEASPSPLVLTADWAHLQLDTGRCEAHVLSGRLDEAERLAQDGYRRAVADGHATAKALYAGWLGVTAGLRGTMRTALRWLRDATAGTRPDEIPLLAVLWCEIIQSAVATGDLEPVPNASRQLQRVLSRGRQRLRTLGRSRPGVVRGRERSLRRGRAELPRGRRPRRARRPAAGPPRGAAHGRAPRDDGARRRTSRVGGRRGGRRAVRALRRPRPGPRRRRCSRAGRCGRAVRRTGRAPLRRGGRRPGEHAAPGPRRTGRGKRERPARPAMARGVRGSPHSRDRGPRFRLGPDAARARDRRARRVGHDQPCDRGAPRGLGAHRRQRAARRLQQARAERAS